MMNQKNDLGWLVITRKAGEAVGIIVNDKKILVSVSSIGQHQVRLAFQADKETVDIIRLPSDYAEKFKVRAD